MKEPVGVAGQIVPWNYPLTMTTWKLAPALAAGCSIVLKPDSQTPLSALRMAELATEVGFPPGALNVVPGEERRSAHTSSATWRQDRVHGLDGDGRRDHAGWAQTDQAADSSSGARVRTLPRRREPRRSCAGGGLVDLLLEGQSCEARSCVLVEQSLYDEFVQRFSDRAQALKVGDLLEAETQMGSLNPARASRQGPRMGRERRRRGRGGRHRRRAGGRERRLLPADRLGKCGTTR